MKIVEKYYRYWGHPTPYDLVVLDQIYDPSVIREYFEPDELRWEDKEEAINYTLNKMRKFFGKNLISFRLTGSFAKGTHSRYSDLDGLLILKNVPRELPTEPIPMHLKIITKEGAELYLLLGDPLISTNIIYSKVIWESEDLSYLKDIKPKIEISVPYLKTKSLYSLDTAQKAYEFGKKYKSVALHLALLPELAERELEIGLVDESFLESDDETVQIYNDIAQKYFLLSLDRAHFSLTQLLYALYVIENQTLCDIEELIKYSKAFLGGLVEDIYKLKKAYKRGLKPIKERDVVNYLINVKIEIPKIKKIVDLKLKEKGRHEDWKALMEILKSYKIKR